MINLLMVGGTRVNREKLISRWVFGFILTISGEIRGEWHLDGDRTGKTVGTRGYRKMLGFVVRAMDLSEVHSSEHTQRVPT